MGKIYSCLVFIFLMFSLQVSGQSYNWSASLGGSNTAGTPDEIIDVATDGNGNTFVVGTLASNATVPGGTPATTGFTGLQDVFLAKYNSAGVIQWHKRVGAAQPDKGVSIIANPTGSGEVYVSGIIQANQYFHFSSSPFIYLPAATPGTRASEMFVARYNSTSGNCEWVRGIGADGGSDAPAALEFDNLGNICVAGYIGATANIYDQRTGAGAPVTLAGSSALPFNGVFDIAVVKLTTAGAFVSSQVIGGTGSDQPTAMHFDGSGNMYLAGVFSGTMDVNPSGAAQNIVESNPQGSGDAFLAKYNSSGNLIWVGTLRGANQEFIRGIGLDGSGNVYVTGSFSGFENFDLLGGTQTLTASGPMDMFIASYDAADGSFNYVNKIGGASGNNSSSAIHVLSSGDQYVSGYFSGAGVDFDPSAGTNSLSSAGNKDAFLAKYTSTGANAWAIRMGGTNDDAANSVNLTSDSKIVWGGYFNGATVDADPGAGTTNLTAFSNEDMFVISYNECVGAAITAQPAASQSICTGQNATFTVAASGTGLTYQWKKGGVNLTNGGNISGATSSTLTITGLVSGDAATYTVDVIGCAGTVTSNNAVLTVPSGASITGQPIANQTLCAGASASMTVTASGTGLTYQWKKAGVNLTNGGTISGATSATLNISSLVSGDAASYTVDVTASGCGAPLTSSASVLAVNSAAAITVQPVTTQTLCAGSAAAFSVTATGTGLTYQWKKGGVDLTDGGTISGATTAALNISSIVSGDAGSYTVVVTGTCGSPVTSSASALIVNTGVAITAQPAATQTLCTGNAAAFNVTASGSGLTYQWKKGGVDLVNGGTVSGALTNSLAISSLVPGDAATYTVVVSGTCGSPVTSSNAVLTVNTGAAITGQPAATQTLCAGTAASMTVTATGSSLTYQWKKGGVNLTNGGTISGATTATLNISSLAPGDAGNYTVDVTASGCGSAVTSSTSVLAVNTAPSITAQPAAIQTLCTGNAAAFNVTASGSGLTYQWKKGGVDLVNGGTVSGALTNSLAISSLVPGDAATYTVVVSGTCGSPVTSSNAVLTVNTGAAITGQPAATQTLCTGTAASMTVTATGSSLTYQWKKGGVNLTNGGTISGATTATLNISSLAPGDAGNYTVDVTASGCGSPVTSSTSALAVSSAPSITGQPVASQTFCTGNAAAFSVTASGTGLTYQWKKGGVDVTDGGTISGATTSALAISSLVSSDAGSYTVVVSGTCGSPATSSASVLTVNSGASISMQPIPVQTLCVGDLAVFSVTASGTGLTYQWQKDGVNVTNGGGTLGATTATLSIGSVIASNAGNYTVNVTASGCGSPVTSSISQLIVNSPINITTQPAASPTLCTGNAATFTVVATGSSLTYQWQKNGVNIVDGGTISGAATSTLNISSLVSGDAGTYTVNINGVCGSPVTSSNSVLTVNTGPSITTQPVASQTLCTSSAASFTVAASGSGLSYQWQLNGTDLTDGGSISGATSTTLNIASLASADAGNYTVNVSASGCGAPLVSAVSALTVNSSIAVTTQPVAAQTLCTGNGASFSIAASGTGITYQWQKDGVDLADGGTISGATTSTLTISSLVSADAGTYTVDMTGACAPLTSASSVLTVNTGASIITQPVATQTLCAGTAASFAVSASGSGLTYQWQLNGVDLADGGTISGATTATLGISSVTASDAGNYTVNVTAAGCGSPLTSTISTLTVNSPIVVTTQPVASQTLCTGNAASFSIVASGTGITYQWQKDGVDLADGGTISGATTSTLDISSLVSGDAGTYTVDMTGACAPLTSASSVLTVNTGASITTQPVATQTLCAGSAASFSVLASGSGLSYQWQLNGVDVADGGTISGATTATLDISSLAVSDAGDYTVNVTAAGCGAPLTSTISALTVNTPITITTQPVATQTLCTGNAASFNVVASGTSPTYQWQLNGVDLADGGTISGATTSTLDISSLVTGDAGTYTVNISGVCGSPVTSSDADLTVNVGASITTQPAATQTLCAGAAASFTVSAGGSGLTYQWQLDGVDLTDGGTISGATAATLDISSVAVSDAGDYTVNVTAAGCGTPLTSTISALTVNTPVSITTQPVANQTLCTGNAASFNVAATGTGLNYQWQKDGADITDGGTISGATTSTLDISSLVTGDAGTYTVDITGVCGAPVTSSTAALTVNVGASITTQPVATQTVCTGNPVSFTVAATGSSLSYQWKRNGANLTDGGAVSGATAATLTISSVAAGDAGDYTVDVSAAGCGVPLTSSIAALVVNNSIVVNNQPVANQNLCSGSPALFSVMASGTGITYQWKKDGVNLTDGGTVSGATTASLNISSVAVGDAGNYTVDMTGTCGAVTSTTSVLSVTASVSITMQPVDVNACAGQTTNFDMTATGPSLTYQWRKNGVNLVDGGNISGATTSSLVFLNVSAADADVYDVVVSSSCGTPVTSNTVTLTVGVGVAITKQPISAVICLGQSASFTIQAPGATGYQWQFKPAGGSYADLPNGSGVSGATTPTLIITGTQFSNRGNYRCVVSGGSCSGGVFSAAASLSFQSPSIASQPLSQSVCAGQMVTFGVVALGNNLTYQWVKNGTNMVNGGRISGAQSATLKIIGADATDEATYYCEVKGLCPPPTYSDNVDLTLTTCTGIEDAISGDLFNIYPNPSTGIYHLDMDMYASGTLTYEVYNVIGERITQNEINGEGKVVSIIDLSTQVAGVYIVKLNYDDKHAWIRVVLEK